MCQSKRSNRYKTCNKIKCLRYIEKQVAMPVEKRKISTLFHRKRSITQLLLGRVMIGMAVYFSTFFLAHGQNLHEREHILEGLLNELRTAKNNEQKKQANTAFKHILEETILLPGAFDHPFEHLKTLGSITSPDSAFRLFNWNVEQDDLTQIYYCYILSFDARKAKYHLIELKDNSLLLPPRPSDILTADNWYGALYYKIIPIKKGSKTVYTVLGWDGNNSMSTVKVIDALTFTGSSVRLGSPIFRWDKQTHKRIFFEFAKKTTMYLAYEPQYNRIVFDHLSPEAPALEGLYSMYLPDLSYDAFVEEKGKWILVEDVVAINKKNSDYITVSYIDNKTGDVKEKKIKNKWEKPSESHVATLPEEQIQEDTQAKNNVLLPPSSSTTAKQKSKSYNPVDGSGKKYMRNKLPKKRKRSTRK